jgi:hypothetical protein
LAISLNTLATRLSELGRREEALKAAEEAADLYRALAATRPEAFTRNFGISLNTLSDILSQLGRQQEAAALREEIARVRR